ncbi:restriction endonuclease subunit S [Escherichia coli]|uniref:restriction endonuclease subunit S n=1 Tax=Escherichia coli TaxID=562 RepID=UPI001F0D3865|nr:restriction endonuclease subunit S [Escherichia coli]
MSSIPKVKLGNFLTISKGKKYTIAHTPSPTSYRYIQIDDLRNDNNIIFTDEPKGVIVEAHDLIIAWDGANAGTIGYGLAGKIGSTLARLKINDRNNIDTRYVGYFLKSKFQEIRNHCTGATIPHVNKEHLLNLSISLPEITIQNKISDILDKANGLQKKREQAINLADAFLHTKFLEMFSNEKIKRYPITKINEILAQDKNSIRTGPFGSQLLHSEFTESGIAVLGIDNAVKNEFQWGKPRFISPNKYETLKRYTVFPGDVIITIMGTCGRCAVVPDDIPVAINTKHLCCISLDKDKCSPEFLHSYFLTHPLAKEYLAKHSKGAIMDGLNMGVIKHMPFPEIPLEKQYEFVNIKNKIKQLKNKLNSSKIDCEYNFTTLCNDIFNMQG